MGWLDVFRENVVKPTESVPIPETIPQVATILPLLHCGHRDSRWAIDPRNSNTVCLNCYMETNQFIRKPRR